MPKKRARSKQLQDKPKVEVVNRPLFHKGTKELLSMFSQAKRDEDLDTLESLAHELSFRNKPQSIALAEMVQKELARYKEQPPQPPPQPDPVPPVLKPQPGQPPLPFPKPTPPADTPLRDVLLWLETVAQGMTDEQARALRESLKARYPGFAEFAAEREGGTK